MLLQGLSLPTPRIFSASSLPPTLERPSSLPPPPVEQFQFTEPEDTYGQGQCRRRSSSITSAPMPATSMNSAPGHSTTNCSILVPEETQLPVPTTAVVQTTDVATEEAVTTEYMSRTTLWRHLKRQRSGQQLPRARKVYSCSKCGKPCNKSIFLLHRTVYASV